MVAFAQLKAIVPILSGRPTIYFSQPRATCTTLWRINTLTPCVSRASLFTSPSICVASNASPFLTKIPSTNKLPSHQPHIQSMDFSTLLACVIDLRKHWLPARIEEAIQYSPSALALRLRTLQASTWLYISWHQNTAHIGTSINGPHRGSVSEAFSFGAMIHSSLRGLVLTDATLPQKWERAARFVFAQRPGEDPKYILHVEIMGRYSNVVLCHGQDDIVIAAGHQVGSKMSSMRLVQIGKSYTLPPPPRGIPPESCSSSLEDWRNAIQFKEQSDNGRHRSVSECGIQTFLGVSPSIMRDLCSTAHIKGSIPPSKLDQQQWERLFAQWKKWLDSVEGGTVTCVSLPTMSTTVDEGNRGGYSVIAGVREERSSNSMEEGSTSLDFIHKYYRSFEESDDFEKGKHRIQRGIANGINRLGKKIASLQQQKADPTIHAATHHIADLLMAHLHLVEEGAMEITVIDWETDKEVSIPLDPEKTPVAYAEALYAKARKQRRATEQVTPLIEEATGQLEYLQEVECMVGQLRGDEEEDAVALRQTEAEMVAGGYLKMETSAVLVEKAAAKARKASKKSGGRNTSGNGTGGSDDYRRYASPGGFTVLVGRNSSQNDVLTMRIAREGDVWMHARGVPGAHVLLQVPAGRSPGDDDMQFAADIAAFFSKSRLEGKTDITIANPADISKPRGAKLGQVMVKKEKVMVGRSGNSAAARLEEK